jgi:hypothetical protein
VTRSRLSGSGRDADTHERAITDLVGFAVVFGLVALSITLVYTFGVGALTDVQRGEAFDNAERAFDITADNMADIHQHGAPSRSTELDFPEGDLALTGQTTLTVRNSSDAVLGSFVVTPIRYRNDEQALHYSGGAVVRSSRDAAVMVSEPPFRFTSERSVISVVETKPAGDTRSLSGGTVRVTARRVGSSVPAAAATDGPFEVTVTSPRFEAWQRYFENEGSSCDVDPAKDTVRCEVTTDELYIRRTLVRVYLTP